MTINPNKALGYERLSLRQSQRATCLFLATVFATALYVAASTFLAQ